MKLLFDSTEQFKTSFLDKFAEENGKEFSEATMQEIYLTLVELVKDYMNTSWVNTLKEYKKKRQRQIYYFSMEFLIGRLLRYYLVNLGISHYADEALKSLNIDIDKVFSCEDDPGLGNGGLGRLAACFMDSLSFLGIPGHGNGIRYKYGLFNQKIENGYQKEVPDQWLKNGYPWERCKIDKAVVVKFKGNLNMYESDGKLKFDHTDYEPVLAVPYDVPMISYNSVGNINNLRLWNAEVVSDFIDMESFNAGNFATAMSYNSTVEAISYILYPEDSGPSGRELRLKQEYFMVSAGIQSIIRHYKLSNDSISDLHKKVVIHINDTHPALAVPELMRLLMDEEGLGYDEAWHITVNTISYTNHTILPEAMEKWNIGLMRYLVPRVYQIIEEIDRRFRSYLYSRFDNAQELIDSTAVIMNEQVHMAHLAVIGSHAVNGVADLHTEILKSYVLNSFYKIYPERFNNKTNGVSYRRFLLSSNYELSSLITKTIGYEWKFHPEELEKLLNYKEDTAFLDEFMHAKFKNKQRLAEYIKTSCNITVDPNAIFDIHVKRIHAYKRQLLNIFKVIALYDRISRNPQEKITPCVFIFAGKAAPGYRFAKKVIKLINSVADKVNNDAAVGNKIKVLFLENFNVSLGEIIYPAADISEQISTASQEASGTGNMKFMMNGAVTLGTMDGANVEISQCVGLENMKIFGISADEVLNYLHHGGYDARYELDSNPQLKMIIGKLLDDTFAPRGEFNEIVDVLLSENDPYFIFKDFDSYMQSFNYLHEMYTHKYEWAAMSLTNTAKSSVFSSDRTIMQYADEIWHIDYFDRID